MKPRMMADVLSKTHKLETAGWGNDVTVNEDVWLCGEVYGMSFDTGTGGGVIAYKEFYRMAFWAFRSQLRWLWLWLHGQTWTQLMRKRGGSKQ